MDFIGEIASQGGPGWVLFAGSLVVLGIREKAHHDTIKEKDEIILSISEKRVEDAEKSRESGYRNMEALRSIIDQVYVIVQNLQNIANNKS
jgi:hypothetical protein